MAHTVMVTGADGFIGSHLTEELVRKGEKVKAFCYYNSFGKWGWLDTLPPEIKNEIEVFMGDIRDPNGVRTAMKGQEIVYHLAALIAIPFSYHSPDSYVDTNIKGTLNIHQRGVRDCSVCAHRRAPSLPGTEPLLRHENRRGPAGRELLPLF